MNGGADVMRTARLIMGAAACSVLLAPSAALAQTTPKAPQPAPPEVMEPPGEHKTPPADPSTGNDEPKKPLTKELHEGEGVIEPPRGVDPKIEKTPPEGFQGNTPVIPPPGEPGGGQDVQPK
jgi:hypothetical protein